MCEEREREFYAIYIASTRTLNTIKRGIKNTISILCSWLAVIVVVVTHTHVFDSSERINLSSCDLIDD